MGQRVISKTRESAKRPAWDWEPIYCTIGRSPISEELKEGRGFRNANRQYKEYKRLPPPLNLRLLLLCATLCCLRGVGLQESASPRHNHTNQSSSPRPIWTNFTLLWHLITGSRIGRRARAAKLQGADVSQSIQSEEDIFLLLRE